VLRAVVVCPQSFSGSFVSLPAIGKEPFKPLIHIHACKLWTYHVRTDKHIFSFELNKITIIKIVFLLVDKRL
jgi:hypothetical protein